SRLVLSSSVHVTPPPARARVMVQRLARLLAELLPATFVVQRSEQQPAPPRARWLGTLFRKIARALMVHLLRVAGPMQGTHPRPECSGARTPAGVMICEAF